MLVFYSHTNYDLSDPVLKFNSLDDLVALVLEFTGGKDFK